MASGLKKIITVCRRDNLLYNAQIIHNGVKMELRDSYKMIVAPLRDFQKMFNLDVGKRECIPYTFYRLGNLDRANSVGYEEVFPHVRPPHKSTDETSLFMEIIREEREDGCQNYRCDDRTFDALEYYKYYHRMDCLVLMKGLQAFDRNMASFARQSCGICVSLFSFLTSSSFADYYMGKSGCYRGVCEVTGRIRRYVQGSVRGGRVYVNPRTACTEIDTETCDLDAKSLYPSAMKRIGETCGMPIGGAKKIPAGCVYPFPPNWNYYVVRIKITRIGVYQEIPMVSYKNVSRGVEWPNKDDPIPPEQVFTVNKVELEDWIGFCGIEYQLIDGLYWDEGANHRLGDVIVRLHELKSEYRRVGNPCQSMVKLCMNGCYGRLAMRQCDKNVVIQDVDNAHDYAFERYGILRQILEFGDHAEITLATYDDSFTRKHLGSLVLSMARRIMNEVIDTCTRAKIPLYYTDTDSLHFPMSRYEELRSCYRSSWHRELIGDSLGQFHSDFSLYCGHSKVISKKCIFVSKKTYCHVLLCKQCGATDYHYRMKGIPAKCIIYKTCELNCTVYDLYCELASGASIDFELNPPGMPRFDSKITGISTKNTGSFVRTVCINSSDL